MTLTDQVDDRADIMPLALVSSLARTLRDQAEKLRVEAASGDGFHKPVADGLGALARTAKSLITMAEAAEARHGASREDELIDIQDFFEAVEERIENLARERATDMVGAEDTANCSACGAALRAVGAS